MKSPGSVTHRTDTTAGTGPIPWRDLRDSKSISSRRLFQFFSFSLGVLMGVRCERESTEIIGGLLQLNVTRPAVAGSRLFALWLVVFQEGRRHRKIVLTGAPVVKGPWHTNCVLWAETAVVYCMMKPGCGAMRGEGRWGRAGGYWDRKWLG